MKKIVGYKRIDYNKKDGTNVKGYTLYVIDDNKENNELIDKTIEGLATDNFYCNDEVFDYIVKTLKSHGQDLLNSEFSDYRYNRFGRVCGVLFLDE